VVAGAAEPRSAVRTITLEVDEGAILEMVRDGKSSAEIVSALGIVVDAAEVRLLLDTLAEATSWLAEQVEPIASRRTDKRHWLMSRTGARRSFCRLIESTSRSVWT
jgi:hypothetical protein